MTRHISLDMTFDAVVARWIESKRRMVKQSSFCAYNLLVRTHLLPKFGSYRMVTEEEVQEFVLEKISSGLSRKTVKDILATLKSIVRFGEKHYGFPGEKWEISFPTDVVRRRLPVLSVTHHRKLLRDITIAPDAQNIGILLALCTGMRIGEVCALRWRDVDLSRRVITVTHTLGRIYDVETKTTKITLTTPKTKSSYREIPISKELYSALRDIKRSVSEMSMFVVGCSIRPKEPRTYREYFTRFLSRRGIPRIVFHGLRHTFATRCIECMCDYKTVSVILGHSNVATTMNLYVHPNQDQKKRCIDKLSKFVGRMD